LKWHFLRRDAEIERCEFEWINRGSEVLVIFVA